MESRKGFTLVELMVVILIVGILASTAVPIMRGRINSAKWTEGRTGASTVRDAVRIYIVEKGPDFDFSSFIEGCLCGGPVAERLGFKRNDLDGAYFDQDNYEIWDIDPITVRCRVTVGPSDEPGGPPGIGTLATDGTWSVSTE